jgi:hypothetical protein
MKQGQEKGHRKMKHTVAVERVRVEKFDEEGELQNILTLNGAMPVRSSGPIKALGGLSLIQTGLRSIVIPRNGRVEISGV